MPYIGRPIGVAGHTTQKLDDPTGISSNAFTMKVATVAISPDAASLQIYVDGVRQEAGVAYTVSGSTLTFTGTFTSSNDFQGYVMGDAMYIQTNSVDSDHYVDGSIDNAHLADDAVDSDELAAGAVDLAHMSVNSIDSDQYVDGSIDNAHLADDAVDSDELAAGSVDIAHLSASGTAGSGNFLRGDNSWTAVTSPAITSIAGTAANQLLTDDGDGTVTSEANLTYDGTDLSMFKDSENTEFIISAYHDTEATTPQITLRKGDNTQASPALVDDDAVLGTISFQGYDGDSWAQGAKIEARAEGTPASDDMASELTFWTTPDSSQTAAQRMTIGQDGKVSIGDNATIIRSHFEVASSADTLLYACTSENTNDDADGEIAETKSIYPSGTTSTSHNASALYKLWVRGQASNDTYSSGWISCFKTTDSTSTRNATLTDWRIAPKVSGGDPVEKFRVSGGGDTYTNDGSVSSLSDVRVKKNIEDLTDGLDIVNQLRPRTFEYNGKASLSAEDGVTRYGFIADEVLECAPQYVELRREEIGDEGVDEEGKLINGTWVEDFKTLSTGRLIPMLVNAIQELSAKVEALENA